MILESGPFNVEERTTPGIQIWRPLTGGDGKIMVSCAHGWTTITHETVVLYRWEMICEWEETQNGVCYLLETKRHIAALFSDLVNLYPGLIG